MFNVSLKVDMNILTEINSRIMLNNSEWKDWVKDSNRIDWPVIWSNYEAFKLKVATTLHRKHLSTIQLNKSFSFSINSNSWIAFRYFLTWLEMKHPNQVSDPYFGVIIREIREQVQMQMNSKEIVLNINNN